MQPPARSNRAYRIVAHIVRPLLRAMTRHDWSGTENFPRDGGFIVASNHMTNIDPLTFAHFLWDNGVAPKILAKALAVQGARAGGRAARDGPDPGVPEHHVGGGVAHRGGHRDRRRRRASRCSRRAR